MNKAFPISASGVANYGVESWLEEYKSPLSNDVFQEIYDHAQNCYCQASLGLLDDAYWAFICNFRIPSLLANKLFFIKRCLSLRSEGYQFILDNETFSIDEFQRDMAVGFAHFDSIEALDPVGKLRCHWRKIRTNLGAVSPFEALFPSRLKNSVFLLGDRNAPYLAAYCQGCEIDAIALQPRLYYQRSHLDRLPDSRELRTACELFFDKLGTLLPELSSFLDEPMVESTFKQLNLMMAAIKACRKSIDKFQIGDLLLDVIGNIHHRIFSVAWRNCGGIVKGFSHGKNYCEAYKPRIFRCGSHSLVDKYVVSSKGEALLTEEGRRSFSVPDYPFPELDVNPTNIYMPICERFSKYKKLKSVSRVMLIGFPCSFHYHPYHPEQHQLAHLHLELRLIQALRDNGFTIIYKAHPDSKSVTEKIYRYRVDEFLVENLEEIELNVDCVVFASPATTAFGYLLLSHLPLVLIDTKGNIWHPDVLPPLRRRCAVVPAAPDGFGRIELNMDEFIEAVKNSPDHDDYSIVEKYAL